VILLDDLLIGGLKFVLGKVAEAVDAERSDDSALREELLANQMRLELGEIDEAEFKEREADLLRLIREVRGAAGTPAGAFTVESIEATVDGEGGPASRRR
jgi:hypothetical protein